MNALQPYPFQHWSHRASHNDLRSVCHTNGLVFGVKRFWFCLGASCNEYTKQTDLECFKPNVFPKNVLRESITPSKTLKTFEIDPGAVSIVCSVVLHNLDQGFIETTWVCDWKMGLEGSKKKLLKKTCRGRTDVSKTPKLVEIGPVVAEFFATVFFSEKKRSYRKSIAPV